MIKNVRVAEKFAPICKTGQDQGQNYFICPPEKYHDMITTYMKDHFGIVIKERKKKKAISPDSAIKLLPKSVYGEYFRLKDIVQVHISSTVGSPMKEALIVVARQGTVIIYADGNAQCGKDLLLLAHDMEEFYRIEDILGEANDYIKEVFLQQSQKRLRIIGGLEYLLFADNNPDEIRRIEAML